MHIVRDGGVGNEMARLQVQMWEVLNQCIWAFVFHSFIHRTMYSS